MHSALLSLPIRLTLLQGLNKELLLLHTDQTSLQRQRGEVQTPSAQTEEGEQRGGSLRVVPSLWNVLASESVAVRLYVGLWGHEGASNMSDLQEQSHSKTRAKTLSQELHLPTDTISSTQTMLS